MAQSFSSGTQNVTGTVTASASFPAAGTGQTIKQGQGTGGAGTTVYTVTAGKTFYCMGFILGNGNASARNMTIYDGTTTWVNTYVPAGGNASGCGTTPIFTASAGTTIKLNTNSGAADGYLSVWGYEA